MSLARIIDYNDNISYDNGMSDTYHYDQHRVHRIVNHLVWTPKQCKAVLIGDIAADCQALIEKKCSEMGWPILELAIQPDHIHLVV